MLDDKHSIWEGWRSLNTRWPIWGVALKPCKVRIFRVYNGIMENTLLQLDEDGAVEDGLDEDGDPTPPPEANIRKYALYGRLLPFETNVHLVLRPFVPHTHPLHGQDKCRGSAGALAYEEYRGFAWEEDLNGSAKL